MDNRIWTRSVGALEVAANAAILVLGAVMFFAYMRGTPPFRSATVSGEPSVPTTPLDLADAPVKGSLDAPVGMIIYSDFQCPFCARFSEQTMPALLRDYVATGKVLMAFRHVPLVRIHDLAQKAAEGAECARRQNRFWEYHDRLFTQPSMIAPPDLLAKAEGIGVDLALFRNCLDGEAAERVAKDTESARTLGVTSTPAFFIGQMVSNKLSVSAQLRGAKPLKEFTAALDEALRGPRAVSPK